MTAYNIVNSGHLVAGQNEDVSDVLANFQAIATVLNGNVDGTNLKNYPGDSTKALFGDMSWRTIAQGMAMLMDFTVVGAPQGSIDTNTILGGNIPQTYKHLLAVMLLQSGSGATDTLVTRMNNDSGGTSYSWAQVVNTTLTSSASDSSIHSGLIASSGGTTAFSPATQVISDYTDSTRKKGVTGTAYNDVTPGISSYGGSYYGTAAITRLAWLLTGGSFQIGSRVTLYGLS